MMTSAQKLASLGLVVALLLALGAGGGVWLAARHYRPSLNAANTDLAKATSARDNLEELAGEQGKTLGELRERNATLAQEKATQEAQPDYATANQLLRERTDGDPAQAAAAIIDQAFIGGAGPSTGRMCGQGARGAHCSCGGAGAGAVQDATSGCAAVGSAGTDQVRQPGGEGAGFAG